jgi:DNA-binding NtrC family response regulator
MKGLNVLIIDDEPLMRLSMVDALEGVGCEVAAASTGTEGIHALKKRPFDVVITDLRLPGADGLAVLKACKERDPNTEVILITAHGSVDTAVGAIKLGAFDYITKPFQMDELLHIVERVGKMFELRRDNVRLDEAREDGFSFGGIIGRHKRMRAVLDQIKLIAAADSTVLITGESGTGKELAANAIHLHSARKDHALVKVSCAAISEDRLESELFGHEKGAFPGAMRQRRGRFELANKGTVFLDEIAEVSAQIQNKLLGLLQERRFKRLGGTDTVDVDVRMICSTSKDLKAEVSAGRFSEDFLCRLQAAQIIMPALRERPEDIFVIAQSVSRDRCAQLGKQLKGFAPAAEELLGRYSFPGNVRELETTVEQAVERAQDGERIEPWDLCGNRRCPYLGGPVQESCGFCREGLTVAARRASTESLMSLVEARDRFERDYIKAAIDKAEGNLSMAAQLLGLSEKALQEKCKRYNVPSVEVSTEGE